MQPKSLLAALLLVALLAGVSWAQDVKNPEELKKLHDEAVAQLKAAQDRKNELAAENEKLAARIAELEAQLAQRDAEASAWAERTWFLRAHYAAWKRFVVQHPEWLARWEAYSATEWLDSTDWRYVGFPTTAPSR